MARKSGFVRRSGVMRRETLWFVGAATRSTLGAGSTATLVTALNAAGLALRPFTIIRTVGHIFHVSDQAATSENRDVAWGCCVVSDQAVAVGVTAVPTPATENGSDLWYLHGTSSGRYEDDTSVGFNDIGHVQTIESKAARKVEEGQDIITVVETFAISAGCNITTFMRTLIKLH